MKRNEGRLIDATGTRSRAAETVEDWTVAAANLHHAIGALAAPGEAIFVRLSQISEEGSWNPDRDYRQPPFAQVDVTPAFALRTIFGCNQFLAPEFKIDLVSEEAMLRLGFSMPQAIDPSDPDRFSWGHYFLREDAPLNRVDMMLAAVIVRGFRDCFGVEDPTRLRFTQWLCDWRD